MRTRRELEARIEELQTLADNNYASMKYHSDNYVGLLQQYRKLEGRHVTALEIVHKLQGQLDEVIAIAEQAQFGWEAASRIKRYTNNEFI